MDESASVHRAGLKIVVLAMLMLGLMSSQAWAGGWLKSGEIHTQLRDVGFDGANNAIGIGVGRDDLDQRVIEEVTRSPGGGWSEPKTIAGPTAANPNGLMLAVNSKGEAVTVWSVWGGLDSSDVSAAVRNSAGVWQVYEGLGEAEGTALGAAIDEAGRATIFYLEYGGKVVSRTRPAGGTWGSPFNVSGVSHPPDTDFHVATNTAGEIAVIWTEFKTAIRARKRDANGNWGTIDKIEDGDFEYPRIAIGKGGDMAAVWENGPGADLSSAWKPASGSWGSPSQGMGEGVFPEPVVDSKGAATIVWSRASGGEDQIVASQKPVVGDWSSPKVLFSMTGTMSDYYYAPKVAVGYGDEVLAFWTRVTDEEYSLHAVRQPKSGEWMPGGVMAVDPAMTTVPRLSVDPQGQGLVTWGIQGTAQYPRLYSSAILDWSPPELNDVVLPGQAQIKKAVYFSVKPFDLWSPVTTKWTFPGATADGNRVMHSFNTAGVNAVRMTATDAAGNAAVLSRNVIVSAVKPTLKCRKARNRSRSLKKKVRRTGQRISRLNRKIARAKAAPRKRKLRRAKVKARKTLRKQRRALRRSNATARRICRVR